MSPSRSYSPCISIGLSAAAHALLIAALIWGALLFRPGSPAGPGAGVVDVWLSSPGGGEIGGAGPVEPQTPPTPRAPSALQARRAEPTAPEPSKRTGENDAAGPGSGGEGGGAGGGSGAGIGSGSDDAGNPTLAQIWKRINSAKYYPAAARRRGAIGSPRVTFAIQQDGSVAWVKIAASCGEEELDAAALETVRRAAPLPYYSGPITLAVRYALGR